MDVKNLFRGSSVESSDFLAEGGAQRFGVVLGKRENQYTVECKSLRTYVKSSLAVALLLIDALGFLVSGANGSLYFAGDGLIRSESLGTNSGIEGAKVVEEAFRDALFV